MRIKKWKAEISALIILFFVLQFGFMFLIRNTLPRHQECEVWRPTKVTWSIPSPLSRTSSVHNTSKPSSKTPLTPTHHLSSNLNPTEPTIICNRSHHLYDWCQLRGPTILEPREAKFYTRSSTFSVDPPIVQTIRPYPRKNEIATMSNVREITLTTELSNSPCTIVHDTPALVISIGGYTGNFFHDFNDGFVPLYITINTLFPNQDVTLVVTNSNKRLWYGKYKAILHEFSKLPVINLDNQTVTHCFPSVSVGLITHGPMTINPALIPNQRSFLDFRASLEEGYRKCPALPPPKIKGWPRLVLVSRVGPVGRVILNQDNVIKAAQEEGFDVVIFEPSVYTNLCDVYRLINDSHAIMGVHGAALTHSLFLQPGAAFIQVVPLRADWLAKTYFGNLAKGMKLEYMEYKIQPEESTLAEIYGKDHILVKDPNSIAIRNWTLFRSIYLRSQDVRLDIARLRGALQYAYAKAKILMEHKGFHVNSRPKNKKYIRPPIFSYAYGAT